MCVIHAFRVVTARHERHSTHTLASSVSFMFWRNAVLTWLHSAARWLLMPLCTVSNRSSAAAMSASRSGASKEGKSTPYIATTSHRAGNVVGESQAVPVQLQAHRSRQNSMHCRTQQGKSQPRIRVQIGATSIYLQHSKLRLVHDATALIRSAGEDASGTQQRCSHR